jgi:hypothetical protein
MEPSHLNPTDSVPWREAFPGRVHLQLFHHDYPKNQQLSFEVHIIRQGFFEGNMGGHGCQP